MTDKNFISSDKPYSKYALLTELSAKKSPAPFPENKTPTSPAKPEVTADVAPVAVSAPAVIPALVKPWLDKKDSAPVMLCQTAEAGLTKQLERGCTPSTPRHEKRRLTELMFFRCTTEDRLLIETNATMAGLEKSSYMRAQSTGQPIMKALRHIRADWDELRRYMGVINKAGNVVNQLIVRRPDGNGDMARTALTELTHAARIIASALKELG